jgi:mannitol/fructose-specific phosphotransferase system IIA component (Ntr-type)
MIRRSQRGRLKIYLGYCAGVGKTYRMLQEGQVMRSEGIDVVVGLAETHGRRDIVKLLEGFEIIPRVVREYKGIKIEEMDVDAILARRPAPAVALIDELAHNNVPGSRNLKRYQDVQEAGGINIVIVSTTHREPVYETPQPVNAAEPTPKPICLGDFLSEKTIITWKDTVLKEEVLRDLTRAAYDEGQGFEEIYNALIQREKESSTFFNEGVAFPHLRLEGNFSPRLSLGIIPGGIANISTTKPIRLVFLVISSVNQVETQARILAIASKIAGNNHMVNVLLSAKNSKKALAEINEWESTHL